VASAWGGGSLAYHPYPVAESAELQELLLEIPVAVSGKVRCRITMRVNSSKAEAESIAKENEKIQRCLAGKSVQQVVFVPGRILNFVVN
jgi:leucyl-tRNA synthetase